MSAHQQELSVASTELWNSFQESELDNMPPSIRQPVNIFAEWFNDLEDQHYDEDQKCLCASRFRQLSAQSDPAAIFNMFSTEQKDTFCSVTLAELAGYVCWAKASGCQTRQEAFAGWDMLDVDSQASWVPSAPLMVLAKLRGQSALAFKFWGSQSQASDEQQTLL